MPAGGDLRLSGNVIQKSRFIFTKKRSTIWQKSGCLNHLNERIFQVNIRCRGGTMIPGIGFISIKVWVLTLLILSQF